MTMNISERKALKHFTDSLCVIASSDNSLVWNKTLDYVTHERYVGLLDGHERDIVLFLDKFHDRLELTITYPNGHVTFSDDHLFFRLIKKPTE